MPPNVVQMCSKYSMERLKTSSVSICDGSTEQLLNDKILMKRLSSFFVPKIMVVQHVKPG